MGPRKFTLEGERFDRSKQDIEAVVAGVEPERIQQLAVFIGGKWYPVRQVLGLITGKSPQRVNSGRAFGIMRRYGFPVHDIRRDGRLPEATSPNPVSGDVKGEALRLAVQVVGPGANADAVIRLANRFVEWLA